MRRWDLELQGALRKVVLLIGIREEIVFLLERWPLVSRITFIPINLEITLLASGFYKNPSFASLVHRKYSSELYIEVKRLSM